MVPVYFQEGIIDINLFILLYVLVVALISCVPILISSPQKAENLLVHVPYHFFFVSLYIFGEQWW